MNRRDVLKALAAVPVVGKLVAAEPMKEAKPRLDTNDFWRVWCNTPHYVPQCLIEDAGPQRGILDGTYGVHQPLGTFRRNSPSGRHRED